MLVGTDGWVCVVFVWEETGVPRLNPPARFGDCMTISYAMLVTFVNSYGYIKYSAVHFLYYI